MTRQPTMLLATPRGHWHWDETLDEFAPNDYAIPSLNDTLEPMNGETQSVKIAVRVRGKWAVTEAWIRHFAGVTSISTERSLADALAYPVARSMLAEDINGALFIEANGDGDAWVFRHTKAGTHHDHEKAVRALLFAEFGPAIDAALDKRLEATNAAVRLTATTKHKRLVEFRDDILAAGQVVSRSKHLGQRHKEPHPVEGHVVSEARQAINDTMADWKTTRPDDWRIVAGVVNPLKAALATPPVETRAQQAARLAAAAKKAAAPPPA